MSYRSASPVPSSPFGSLSDSRGIGRRRFLQGAMGVSALAMASGTLTGCGGNGGSGDSKEVTLGSYQSEPTPRKAMEEMVKGFTDGSDYEVPINVIDHETFKSNISNYLQGQADDVLTWFAGYRLRFFADQGLIGDVSDVFSKIDGLPDSMKEAVTAADGKQYMIPCFYYPWGVFYNKKVWEERGYTPPKTWDELLTLGDKIKADGMTPLAFADKGGWEAMGTFDQLNLRINGVEFHRSLLAGDEDWTQPQVKKVFTMWEDLLAISQDDSLGRTWQEAAQGLVRKESAMMLFGLFIGNQFPENEFEDYDFFMFPEIDPAIGTDAVEAPVDGFMMRSKPANPEGAKALLEYLGGAEAIDIWSKYDPTSIASNTGADQSQYNHLQKKATEVIKEAKSLTSFLDRDTRPDFASTVLSPSIQQFIRDPKSIDSILKSVQDQKVSIFGS